jgi:hypothetical protein
MKETNQIGPFGPKRPLDLEKASQRKLETLYSSGYLGRRWGSLWGVPANEYWQLTARGEDLYYLV